ncbi:terminase TerL endonuclease subunit [Vagococcus entomophilus]|uniref:Terminase n=1 Tax=Vagococcus entomophilus TaxID=1160095 RepID=A0A430AK15_9ENTE|nr:terminase TerL endonuclease subunit [Vagococcus entomophilus]RSU08440.1 terminase [Vagococcus entomophilus]
MISHHLIDDYINRWERKEIILNKDRIDLIEYLKRDVLCRDDLYFDEERISNYIKFSERWFFSLDPWEKFITPFIFLYFKEDDELFFEEFFISMGRGGGKNGFITTLATFFISPLHGVKHYDVSVVANSEEQAKTSFKEAFDTIESETAMQKSFEPWKAQIIGKTTKSVFKFKTSNASTKDGGREGCVIYDEIHEMEDRATVDVFSGGLGKVANPREFFIGTDGYVREGFYDQLMERCRNVMKGDNPDDDRIFPFICKLDDKEEVEDYDMWEKANPAFEKPITGRSKRLFNKVKKQFLALNTNPGGRLAFMTKRMNLPEEDVEKDVTSWENIMATNQALPELKNRMAIAGFDYASIRDFASVGLLFQIDGKYVWKTHSFVRKGFLQMVKIKAPIEEWQSRGLLTILDEPSINPLHIVKWLDVERESNGIQKVVADNFRMDLLKPLLEEYGFEYEFIRNPRGVHSKVAPIVEDSFANHKIIYGDNPLMRWYVNNTLAKTDALGNKTYLKKEEKTRKTDGFQAFLMALYKIDELEDNNLDGFLSMMDSIDF